MIVAEQIPDPVKEARVSCSARPGTPSESNDIGRCESCSGLLDLRLYARCDVCGGHRLCLPCARRHVCTPQCLERGCLPGLCVRVISDGQVSERFGVDTASP